MNRMAPLVRRIALLEKWKSHLLRAEILFLVAFLILWNFSRPALAQNVPASGTVPKDASAILSCSSGLKLYDSPFFKICYPSHWHVIHGFGEDYAWWVFSKRKRGERFDKPYIRVIISKGIAQPHLATQIDSVILGERAYMKATNQFKDITGEKLNRRRWREIVVGPEFDILAWYEQIKEKQLKKFDLALDSFWVPPPPRVKPVPPAERFSLRGVRKRGQTPVAKDQKSNDGTGTF